MTTTLNEIELAARWGMSPKTLQRWRTLNVGPEYLKLGKKIMYPLADVEDYENLVRSNFAGIEEILLYLRHAGEASLEQIQAACLGGKQSRSCIQAYLQRLTQSSPPRVKAHMALQDPASPVITVLYSPCSENKGECRHPQTDPIDGPNHHLKFKSGFGN